MPSINRRQPGLQYGLILLASQALNFGINKIPPATLGGILIQTLLYVGFIKVPWNPEDVCISSLKIFKNKDWRSFFLSNFEHGSDTHLYYNMASFLLKGSLLERMYGTINFIVLILIASFGCSGMYVMLGCILTKITKNYMYYNTCAIGFSAVLFALKVIVISEEQNRSHDVGGFVVPSKYAVWTELVLIHFLVPNSSFIGHLGGILVGCLYCYTFIGTIIDSRISSVSGQPIIHEERFYRNRILNF